MGSLGSGSLETASSPATESEKPAVPGQRQKPRKEGRRQREGEADFHGEAFTSTCCSMAYCVLFPQSKHGPGLAFIYFDLENALETALHV